MNWTINLIGFKHDRIEITHDRRVHVCKHTIRYDWYTIGNNRVVKIFLHYILKLHFILKRIFSCGDIYVALQIPLLFKFLSYGFFYCLSETFRDTNIVQYTIYIEEPSYIGFLWFLRELWVIKIIYSLKYLISKDIFSSQMEHLHYSFNYNTEIWLFCLFCVSLKRLCLVQLIVFGRFSTSGKINFIFNTTKQIKI